MNNNTAAVIRRHQLRKAAKSAKLEQYLETADVWTVLDLIVAEFTSDPTSRQCFDSRLVVRAIRLNREHRDER